jgi:hypothetical protein
MIPKFPEFIDLYEVSPAEYIKLIKRFEPYSDYNYVSLFSWNARGDSFISALNGNVVISLKDYLSDKRIISFIGSYKIIDTAIELLDYVSINYQYVKNLQLIPENMANILRSDDRFNVTEDHDNHDYVLSASDASNNFPGSRYKKKRQNIHKFEQIYGKTSKMVDLELLDKTNCLKILELNKSWANKGTDGSKEDYNDEVATKRLLDNYNILSEFSNLKCSSLYIDDNFAAYTIYEIDDNFAILHFAKSDFKFRHSATYLQAKLLKEIFDKYNIDEVNIEQDLGIEGLRTFKMRHSPSSFLKKYTVQRAT